MAVLRAVTVKPFGGDYTSLAAAAVGEVASLPALSRKLRVVCHAMLDTTPVLFGGYTFSDECSVEVVAAPGAEARSPFTGAQYTLSVNNAHGIQVSGMPQSFRLSGLHIKLSATNGTRGAVFCQPGSAPGLSLYLDGLVLEGNTSLATAHGYAGGANTIDIYVRNTVVSGFTGGNGLGNNNNSNVRLHVDHCTVYNCGTGYLTGSTAATARNCIAQGCGTGFSGFSAGNCASNLASDMVPPGAGSARATVGFMAASTGDFRLAPGDLVAIGAGVDLRGEGLLTDLNGVTRPAAPSVGALEFVSSGSRSTVELPLLASIAAAHPPTIKPGIAPTTVGVAFLASGARTFALTVARTAASVRLGAIGSSASVFAPAIAEGIPATVVQLGRITSSAKLHAPTVARTAASVQLPRVGAASRVFSPSITTGRPGASTVHLGAISTQATTFAPTVLRARSTVALDLLESSAALFAPALTAGVRTPAVVSLPFLVSSPATFAPSLSVATSIVGQVYLIPRSARAFTVPASTRTYTI